MSAGFSVWNAAAGSAKALWVHSRIKCSIGLEEVCSCSTLLGRWTCIMVLFSMEVVAGRNFCSWGKEGSWRNHCIRVSNFKIFPTLVLSEELEWSKNQSCWWPRKWRKWKAEKLDRLVKLVQGGDRQACNFQWRYCHSWNCGGQNYPSHIGCCAVCKSTSFCEPNLHWFWESCWHSKVAPAESSTIFISVFKICFARRAHLNSYFNNLDKKKQFWIFQLQQGPERHATAEPRPELHSEHQISPGSDAVGA